MRLWAVGLWGCVAVTGPGQWGPSWGLMSSPILPTYVISVGHEGDQIKI